MKILAYKKETLKQGLRRPIYSYKKDNKKKKKNIRKGKQF